MTVERVELTVRVTWEVDDAVELQAAAVAAEGEEVWHVWDAAFRLLQADGIERMRLPGTRVVAMTLTRVDPGQG